METQQIIGMVVIGLGALITIYNPIKSHYDKKLLADTERYKEKLLEDTERDKRYYEQRERQIQSTHEQTVATQELTYEMKTMRKEVTALEERTHNLEVVVFKKDRT